MPSPPRPKHRRLPELLRPLFWEYKFAQLNWDEDRELIIEKVMTVGSWEQVRWLRRRMKDAELTAWIRSREGRGLSRKQLAFWALLLELSATEVAAWLKRPGRQIWDKRVRR